MSAAGDRTRGFPARTLRRGLVALVLLVSVAVAWSLLRPAPRTSAVATPAPAASSATTVGDMTFLRFSDDSRKVQVKAREMLGQQGDAMLLHGVEATLPYVSEGRPGTLTIAADECQYQAALERAAFKGNVKLRTDDGFELESDSLKYWGDKQRAFTRDPLRFKRGRLSGTAVGLEYGPGSGIQLQDNVELRIDDAAGGAPTEISSPFATASREQHVITFRGGTRVRQGQRELRSTDLRLEMSADMEAVEHATATGQVDAVSGPGAALPGAAASGAGTKRLRCERLEVSFGKGGVLQQAVATGSAVLEAEPGPQQAQERRRVTAPRLRFDFDAEGRLLALHGLPATAGRARAGQRAVLTTEPLSPSGPVARRVESDLFDATLDPASGELAGAEFEGGVAFSEPGRKAWAGHASYVQAAATLALSREPRIVDEGEGSELRGREIRIGTATHVLTASGGVRHSIAGQARGKPEHGKGGGAGLFGGAEPTVFQCREFDYDPQTRRARYRENAVVRSGSDEVRAPLITLDDAGEGDRRMQATGGVVSVLHPRPGKEPAKDAKEPAPVETRSREMQYTEAERRIVYTGDVEIRQGDILTRSPEAIALLTKDGDALDRLLAGEPVEVHQGVRRATGERGTYTPESETFVLTGEKVVLHDVDRRLEGRILTFEVGSDRIRVDGREEVRTEAVFRRKEPPHP